MRHAIALTVFMLTMLVWTLAQQPTPGTGQPTTSQTPGASQQQQPSAPGTGTSGPDASQAPAAPATPDQSQAENQPITEGCLGGSSPNFTLTDKSGKTYKLNFPANANLATLDSHVGESVQVMGAIKSAAIDVTKIGRGRGTCGTTTPKKE